jgi:peroxiredoxin Q/BCP
MRQERGCRHGGSIYLDRMPKAPPISLQPGDPAPDFQAVDTDGSPITLSQFRGKKVILYFYPKDDTPGCTKEACGFRDHFAEVTSRGAIVLGVSTDSSRSHRKFSDKFSLNFPLIADEDRTVVQAYGVWGPKSFMGRTYDGTHRVTFLIDGQGRVERVWTTVKPETHAAEVLAALG